MDNRSLGGSSSRYGALLTATGLPETGCDRVIYDYAIPDQMLVQAGWISAEDIQGHYLTIAYELIRQQALHKALILLLPHRDALEGSVLLDRICALLSELGLAFIDFRQDLIRFAAQTGKTLDEIYLDPRHFTPETQTWIGLQVLARLQAPQQVPPPLTPRARALAGMVPAGYRHLQMTPQAGTPVQGERGSRLLTLPVQELHKGNRLAVTRVD